MSNKEEIFTEVADTLAELFGFPRAEISLTTRLVEDLGLDSIDAIDMAVRLDERMGYEFNGAKLRTLRTVQDIVDLLHTHRFSLAGGSSEPAAARRE